VCGAGETGRAVVQELRKVGRQVVVVDHDPKQLEMLQDFSGVPLIQGDATDEDVLQQAGLEKASGIIAALPSDKDNLVVTVTVRQKYPTTRIVARNIETKMAEKILKAGANSTVSPTHIGGMRLASEMVRPHVVTFLDLMLKERSKTLRIEEIQVPYHSDWVGIELGHIQLRDKFNVSCLALRHSTDDSFRYNPPDTEIVKGNCVLVVMGDVEHIREARAAAEAARVVTG
jgi:voltage-gated potassium channel